MPHVCVRVCVCCGHAHRCGSTDARCLPHAAPCACLSVRANARSLALVGDVPEFSQGRGQLAALEDRLQRRVEGRLGEALQVSD